MASFPAHVARILVATILLWGIGIHNVARAAELIMVERDGCPYCAKWQREVGGIYPKSQESRVAPLQIVRLEDGQPKLGLNSPVRFTPTFLIVDDGREIGRITGYMNDSMFWGLLDSMLARLPEDQKTAAR